MKQCLFKPDLPKSDVEGHQEILSGICQTGMKDSSYISEKQLGGKSLRIKTNLLLQSVPGL